jgi:hypothetical protein
MPTLELFTFAFAPSRWLPIAIGCLATFSIVGDIVFVWINGKHVPLELHVFVAGSMLLAAVLVFAALADIWPLLLLCLLGLLLLFVCSVVLHFVVCILLYFTLICLLIVHLHRIRSQSIEPIDSDRDALVDRQLVTSSPIAEPTPDRNCSLSTISAASRPDSSVQYVSMQLLRH